MEVQKIRPRLALHLTERNAALLGKDNW